MNKQIKINLWIALIFTILSESIILSGIIPDTIFIKIVQYGINMLLFTILAIRFFYQAILHHERYNYMYELKRVIILFLAFVAISLFEIYQTKKFTFETIQELMQLFLPFAYVFFIINIFEFKEIMNLMRISLIIMFIGYIYSIKLSIFNLDNFFMISFRDSRSPFESSNFAEIASGLSTFFIFYRKKSPVCCFISVLFTFLVFKRVQLLMMIVLLIISIIRFSNLKVRDIFIFISGVVVMIMTLVYNYLLQFGNEQIFRTIVGEDIGGFTMGRVYRIWYQLRNFESYGFGSTSHVLYGNLEMDLIKIYMELGIVGLLCFIYCYYSLTRNNFYCYAIISCCFMNLLVASGLIMYVGWMFRILTIASIVYYGNEGVIKKNIKSHSRKVRLVIKTGRY